MKLLLIALIILSDLGMSAVAERPVKGPACSFIGYTEGGLDGGTWAVQPTWRSLVFQDRLNAPNHIYVFGRTLILTLSGQTRRVAIPRGTTQAHIAADHSYTAIYACT